MTKKQRIFSLSGVVALLIIATIWGALFFSSGGQDPVSSAHADQAPSIPVPGAVTMVDLGAKSCIPCKMMEPILEELEKEYEGRAAIIFIDVYENYDAVSQFGIKAIPTQIFYDDQGREHMRHVGFMDKESIVAVLEKLGVE